MNFTYYHRRLLLDVFDANKNDRLFDVSGQVLEVCGIFEPDHRDLRAAAIDLVNAGYCDFATHGSGEFTITMTAAGWELAKWVNS